MAPNGVGDGLGIRDADANNYVKGTEAATLLEQKAEVRLWTNLVAIYLDNELWQSVAALVKLRIINSDIDGVKELYVETYALRAEQVIKLVVFPYLYATLG